MPTKNINRELLDRLAAEVGQKSSDLGEVVTKEGEERDRLVDEFMDSIREVPTFAYGGNSGPVPGENLDGMFDKVANVTKEEALDRVFSMNAMEKVKKEEAEQKRLARDAAIAQILYNAEEEYFMQHKYVMDGKTRRRTRAMIERNYDKGLYRRKKSDLNG